MEQRIFLTGEFGLEREGLRVTDEGRMSHRPHFMEGHPGIVRDFCENQTEINTGVSDSPRGAIFELLTYTNEIYGELEKLGELFWPFSNPPLLYGEDDIPIAQYEGDEKSKQIYREYLDRRYGKYKMTLCGIHVNYSIPKAVIKELYGKSGASENETEFTNALYLKLAQEYLGYGWLVTMLLAASPMADASYFDSSRSKENQFTGMASLRCGEMGYWNEFVPAFSYESAAAYIESQQRYVDVGAISALSELYFPVRLKSKGGYMQKDFMEHGISHIELRNVDVNPFVKGGVELLDLQFIALFMGWLLSKEAEPQDAGAQIAAVANFKYAAHFDPSLVRIRLSDGRLMDAKSAGCDVLSKMRGFYGADDDEITSVLDYQEAKLYHPGQSYAHRVMDMTKDGYVTSGLRIAKEQAAYGFYGWERADMPPETSGYESLKNPRVLYDALTLLWTKDTCAPRLQAEWSRENMTLGQCSITAFLAQDIFGGEVYGVLRPAGNYHCYNVIDGKAFDLTSEQFGGEVLSYEGNPIQSRDEHFSKEEKRLRYEELKRRLDCLLHSSI